MSIFFPIALPAAHREFISRLLEVLPQDSRIAGVAAAGSFLTEDMDEFSDLDLVVVTETERHHEVLQDRLAIAGKLGELLAAFTGEHVGEPRLLICLYDHPLLHVDLKFVALSDAHIRVEEPAILWQRDGKLTAAFEKGKGKYPQPDIEWIDARFWIWIHYGAGKIGRGELFEAIDFIAYLRSTVLGPLALHRAGARPQGVRKIEMHDAEFARALHSTVPSYDAADCLRALKACADLYRQLRAAIPGHTGNNAAEEAAISYMEKIAHRIKSH